MMTNLAQRHPVEGLGLECTARECPNSPVIFVVRFYCSNEDVKYSFNFKFVRDKTININHFFGTNLIVKSTVVNESS